MNKTKSKSNRTLSTSSEPYTCSLFYSQHLHNSWCMYIKMKITVKIQTFANFLITI